MAKKKKEKEKHDVPEKPGPGRCAVCGRFIYYEFKEESYDETSAISNAGRATVRFGYGSELDLKEYMFLICDPCFKNMQDRASHYRFYNKDMKWIKIPRKKHEIADES